MEVEVNHLLDMPTGEQRVKCLVIEGNSNGKPELHLQTMDVIATKCRKKSKNMDTHTMQLLENNHLCTATCFFAQTFPKMKKSEKARKDMLVCPQCVLECPNGNGKKSLLDLECLTNNCRKKVTEKMAQESQLISKSTELHCTEKRMILGATQATVVDESERDRIKKERKLWNDFFIKQDKDENTDFMKVLGDALGRKLSRRSHVPCHFCSKRLPLWLHRCHVRHYHDPLKVNVCNRCTRRYSTSVQLRLHLERAHKQYVGKCIECRRLHLLNEMFEIKKRNNDDMGQMQVKTYINASNPVAENREETNNVFKEERKIA